jgi:hypothetical protein
MYGEIGARLADLSPGLQGREGLKLQKKILTEFKSVKFYECFRYISPVHPDHF